MLVVIFDGNCGICTRSVEWLRKRDRLQRFFYEANQKPGIPEKYGLSREDVERAVWVVDLEKGWKWSGAEAVNRIFQELGGFWRFISGFHAFPGMGFIQERLYVFISQRRHWLKRWGVRPECQARPEACV